MAKRLIFAGAGLSGSVGGVRQFDVGQGTEILLASFPENYPRTAAMSSNCNLALSPAHDFMVLASGSANDWGYFTDPADLNTYTTMPSPSFAGAVFCCAASNTHFAIGGASPFLYVFDRTTKTLQSVSTTGLGSVANLAFSPDGSKLLVQHLTSPYVRVYKISDWTYIDVATAGVAGATAGAHCIFNADGTKIISCSNSTPYLSVHDAVTGARTMNQTTLAYSGRRLKSHNTDPNIVYVARGNTAAAIYELNLTTGAQTEFTGLAITCLGLEIDFDERIAYVAHATASGRQLTMFNLDTRAALSQQSDALRQVMVDGSLRAMVLLNNTRHTLTGTVRDINNAPVAREVLAFERSTGILRAKTTSNATTGNYTLRLPNAGPYDVQFKILAGEQLNDLFYARSEPQPV